MKVICSHVSECDCPWIDECNHTMPHSVEGCNEEYAYCPAVKEEVKCTAVPYCPPITDPYEGPDDIPF